MATLIVRYKISQQHLDGMSVWYRKMDELLDSVPGLLDRQVLKPVPGTDHSVAILRFDTAEHATRWMHAPRRKEMLAEASVHLLSKIEEGIHGREDFWFEGLRSQKNKWKLLLVTFAGVYPLSIVIPFLLELFPIALDAIEPLRSALIAFLICYFMVMLVMPVLSSFLRRWLAK